MKKLFVSFLCLAIAVSIAIPASAIGTANADTNLESIYAGTYAADGVLNLTVTQANDLNDFEPLMNFVNEGGIVVLTNDGKHVSSIGTKLGSPLEVEDTASLRGSETADIDLGIDVAIIYYTYGNGKSGTFIINIGTNDATNLDALIDEALNIIKDRQASAPTAMAAVEPRYSTKDLGVIDVTTTREPKGKVNASYTFATVQQYSGRDYYIVKSTITGYPGIHIGGNYHEKYQSEYLNASIGTSSSSVTVDAYGPSRDIQTGSSTYGVSLGGSISEDSISAEFGLDYSETLNHSDTTVSVSGTSTQRDWEITVSGGAEETFIDFMPGVNFDCPDNKASIDISLSATYGLNSWDTLTEGISINRNVRCSASSAYES